MKFQCAQCGICCHPIQPFSIFEWERANLEQFAKDRQISLVIEPESGFKIGNKMLVLWYYWHVDGRCPFLSKSYLCEIQAKKPLMCAIYPYRDYEIPGVKTWRCVREIQQNLPRDRKMHYEKPLRYIQPTMAYSALIMRFFNLNTRIDMVDSKSFCRISDYTPSEFPQNLQIKNFYAEMTRLNILPQMFLDFMARIDFTNIPSLDALWREMDENLPKILITERDLNTVFSSWEDSPWENISLTNEHLHFSDIK